MIHLLLMPFCGIGERKCTILLANICPMSSRILLISLSSTQCALHQG